MNMQNRFDKRYTSSKHAFGENPEKILVDHYKLIDNSKAILDIGAGQGRHALFLAENGYGVEALEPSEVGLRQLEDAATKNNLPVFCTLGDLATFEPKTDCYSAILLFGIIQILTREQITDLLNNINIWTAAGSLVFVTAFTIDEPSFAKHKKDDTEIGKNSFEDAAGFVRTYLEDNELRDMFSEWEELYYNERITDMHHHGDGNMHQHAVVEAVFKRTE